VRPVHFVSKSAGRPCEFGPSGSECGRPSTHKLGEEIPHDDPNPVRHNLTAYVCCKHFRLVVGGSCGLPKGDSDV
jgi:hypothetical protein